MAFAFIRLRSFHSKSVNWSKKIYFQALTDWDDDLFSYLKLSWGNMLFTAFVFSQRLFFMFFMPKTDVKRKKEKNLGKKILAFGPWFFKVLYC